MTKNQRHVFGVFEETCSKFPEEVCIRIKHEGAYGAVSYAELRTHALACAELFAERGIEPGDRVAILAENHVQYVEAVLGVLAIGAIVVPLDVQYSGEQQEVILKHAEAKLLLGSSRTFMDELPRVEGLTRLQIDAEGFRQALEKSGHDRYPSDISNDSPAVLFYTSGTTSQPKGVVLTHANLLANVEAISKMGLISSTDVVLSFLPLHHAYSFMATVLIPLMNGAEIVFPSSMAAQDLVQSMRETRTTVFVGVPQVFNLMHRRISTELNKVRGLSRLGLRLLSGTADRLGRWTGLNLNKKVFAKLHRVYGTDLRVFVSGGARLEPAITRDFTRWGFTVLTGYGLTETSPVVTFNPADAPIPGSAGKPLPGVDVKIQEPDASGVGEVWVRGPNVMQGYFRDEASTSEVFEDEWFKTGDLGRLDERGYLFLKGRRKELIILGNGKNIHPEELERKYTKLPSIKEMAVLSANGAGSSEEQLVGLIVLDDEFLGQQRDMGVMERLKWDLDNCSTQLATYQRIKGFQIVKEPLPRTRLGKLKRFELPTIYQQAAQGVQPDVAAGSVADQPAADMGDIETKALAYLEEKFQRPVKLSDHLELDLGVDSLGRIELLMNLQDHLGIVVDEERAMDFFMCMTVEQLQTTLRSLDASGSTGSGGESQLNWGDLIREEPGEDMRSKIKLRFGLLAVVFNVVVITILKCIFKLLFWLKPVGRSHLPKNGPCIIAANHASYLDGLFVMCALPYRIILQTYFIGAGQFLDARALKPFGRNARLVPIYKDHSLMGTLKVCAYLMRQNKFLCYFPSGQRSIDGSVQPFKKGVGILIKELGVPVIPVYLEGSFKTWPRGQKWPSLAKIRVLFGEPLDSDQLQPQGVTDPDQIYQGMADHLRERVARLSL